MSYMGYWLDDEGKFHVTWNSFPSEVIRHALKTCIHPFYGGNEVVLPNNIHQVLYKQYEHVSIFKYKFINHQHRDRNILFILIKYIKLIWIIKHIYINIYQEL